MSWTREQKHVTVAAFLGWTLDAFDFFLTVFILKDIAAEFHHDISSVSLAVLTLTLAMRPVGALIFGRIADRYGRRSTLMLNIICYSVFEVLSGLSPNFTVLLVMRALFGIAMGGEWGVGSALTMETVAPESRGFVSGLLQAGYPGGYLLAAIVFGVLYPHMQSLTWHGYALGWRTMFFIGVLPALLVLYIRANVPESPAYKAMKQEKRLGFLDTMGHNIKLTIYAIVLMSAFTFFSHGSQDVYPTFLRVQHHFNAHTVSMIAIVLNIGALISGIFSGFISEKIGRRRTIFIMVLLALPVLPLWAFSGTPLWLAIGAFLMQIAVQGAWGVIPVHLNELSPPAIRATFPGFIYQLGNLITSICPYMQTKIAEANGNNYAAVMATTIAIVAIVIAVLIPFSQENRGVDLTKALQTGDA